MANSRKSLFIKAVVFQFKLGLDAVRDILLSPVAIIFAIIDFINGNNGHQSLFNKLLRFGRKTDQWIGLFNTGDVDTDEELKAEEEKNVDFWVTKIQEKVKQQALAGKLSESAKTQINDYLSKIHKDEK